VRESLIKIKVTSYTKRTYISLTLEFHCLRTSLHAFQILIVKFLADSVYYMFANLCINLGIFQSSETNFANRVKKLDDVVAKSERVFFSSTRVPSRVRREFLQSSRFALRSRFVANRFQRFQYRLKNRTLEERAHVNRIVSKRV